MKTRTLRLGWFVAAITMLLVTSGCMDNVFGPDELEKATKGVYVTVGKALFQGTSECWTCG